MCQVKSAVWTLERGCSVVIANGMKKDDVVLNIVNGRNVGTFFTETKPAGLAPDIQATRARDGGRLLQSLTPEKVKYKNIRQKVSTCTVVISSASFIICYCFSFICSNAKNWHVDKFMSFIMLLILSS